jgi:hypothetical protein
MPFAINDSTKFISPTKTPNIWPAAAGRVDADHRRDPPLFGPGSRFHRRRSESFHRRMRGGRWRWRKAATNGWRRWTPSWPI